MVVEAFVPSVNQSIKTGIEEINVQITELLNYGFRNFGIGSNMASCQVLFQRSEEMKITWCEIRVLGRVFQCLCRGSAQQFCTPVFVKENRVSAPVFETLHSILKLPLFGDEIQMGMFCLNGKPYYTSHYNRRQCCHLLTEISERYSRTRSIYRWRLNAMVAYSILFRHGI
ncbi:hypothetical protein AVEN_24845-1 [Araneus ventricosus]|uniref:Uncharacterized protein n=1 Tax=Araneus ventricosus TaxID=182803 RepID=A0A4Y2BWY1_ARAVE|nr:hypothetical protein AVEN_24845-1 [Araneus ventricosus]